MSHQNHAEADQGRECKQRTECSLAKCDSAGISERGSGGLSVQSVSRRSQQPQISAGTYDAICKTQCMRISERGFGRVTGQVNSLFCLHTHQKNAVLTEPPNNQPDNSKSSTTTTTITSTYNSHTASNTTAPLTQTQHTIAQTSHQYYNILIRQQQLHQQHPHIIQTHTRPQHHTTNTL